MELRYISIRQILDDLLEHPLLKDLTLERAVNHAVNFIRIVGMPPIFEEKVATLEVVDYRTALPCDLFKINQVRIKEKGGAKGIFRYSTDTYHMSDTDQHFPDLTYKTQGGILFSSKRECTIEISYQALATDKDGYPAIPDDSAFINALELYIKKKHFTILYDMQRITPAAFQNLQQEYAFAVGQCQSSLIRPTMDQMESITNMWNTLIPRTNEHANTFIGNGSKERLKLQ